MITPDRWQRIKQIFHSAQEHEPAERSEFLNEACDGDESIREEVEALLTADSEDEEFLNTPAYQFAAGMLADEAIEFKPGQKFGGYTILDSLGSGGMGQIYLAQDEKLGRKIALKLIAREFATDPRRVLRFEQEARAASALNHPNVCVIHEIGNDNGRRFIAMEHINGVTLRDQLSHGPFTPADALHVAIQVGAALASAHASGIVHRDIKPENLMMRPDGYVKVLDFGLAKLTEILPEPRRPYAISSLVRTESGTLMGTIKYMSPEQLRETRIDDRSDIWSLGVVLYEMLTGRTPFEGQTANGTIALIMDAKPATLNFPAEVPDQLREIVTKALAKDRNDRYQTITKFNADLRKLQREMARESESDVEEQDRVQPPLVLYPVRRTEENQMHPVMVDSAILTRLKSQAVSTADLISTTIRTHKTAALFTGVTGVLALLVAFPSVAPYVNRLLPFANESQAIVMKPLTSFGTSVCSAISPDGKLLAHAEEKDGMQRLMVTETATSEAKIIGPSADVQYLGFTFSRDNSYLYFTRKESDGPGILYRMSLPLGGVAKVKEGVDSPISFSPREDRFAFVRQSMTTNDYSLMVSDVSGSSEQTVATRRNGDVLSVYGVAWSPDGSTIICPTGRWDNGYHVSLIAFDVKTGREHVVGAPSWFSVLQVAWRSDMTGLIVSGKEHPTTAHQLWRVSYPDGEKQRITTDLAEYRSVSLSGDNIITVRTSRSWGLWVVPMDDFRKARDITSGVGLCYGLAWPSTRNIVFSAMDHEHLNLFRIDPDGSRRNALTSEGDNYSPATCQDGRAIVYSSNRTGSFNIWRMNAEDGRDAKQLTFSDANYYPACSPDNQWIAFDRQQLSAKLNIWKVPMEGGEPIKVADNYRMPVFSPDSQYIAGRYDPDSGTRDAAIFSSQGGPPLTNFPIPIQEWQRPQWLADGSISYIKTIDGASNIWSVDPRTGKSKQLTYFISDQIFSYAWSPDYKQLACQRGTKISDVTMISSER